jgi:hypothetical protein
MFLTRLLNKLFLPPRTPSRQRPAGMQLSERLLRGPRALVLVAPGQACSLPVGYVGWVQLTLGTASPRMDDIVASVRRTAGELPVTMDAIHSAVPLSIDDAAAPMLRTFLDILAPNGFIDIHTASQDRESMTAVLAGAGFPFSRIQAAQGEEGMRVLAFRSQPTPDQRARHQLRPRSVRASDRRV